jgi:hypothetical protein
MALSTKYTMFSNFDSPNNNLSLASNSNLNQCQTTCNQNNACNGIVFNKNTQTCYTKNNNMWPYGSGKAVPKLNSDIYLKENSIRQSPYHIPTTTIGTDSVTSSNYKNNQTNINEVNPDQLLVEEKINIYTSMKEIELLESKITSLAQQLSIENVLLDENNEKLYHQNVKDKETLNQMLSEYNTIINQKEMNSSIGILNDTNVVITQKNYSYIMWSIFAIGLILVTFSVLHKK